MTVQFVLDMMDSNLMCKDRLDGDDVFTADIPCNTQRL